MRKLASYVAVPMALVLPAVAAAPAGAAPCPPVNNCPPPTVTTLPATNVTDTTARLNGRINPNGGFATYVFEYGPTAAYGSFSSPVGMLQPGMTTRQHVTATITGLQPSTTYHFRLTAGSPAGPALGADMTFRTKARARKQPKLSLKVTPSRDRALPYEYTSTGRLTLPSGVSTKDGCSGKVSVQVKSRAKTISTRRVNVRSNCTYSSKVTFKARGRLKARGSLKVTARYAGNQFLKPATAKSARVRYGT